MLAEGPLMLAEMSTLHRLKLLITRADAFYVRLSAQGNTC